MELPVIINMTEDDTFNKLRKVPFNDIKNMYLNYDFDSANCSINQLIELIEQKGWTWNEFCSEWNKEHD